MHSCDIIPHIFSSDKNAAAILSLARSIVVQRGELSEAEFKAVPAA